MTFNSSDSDFIVYILKYKPTQKDIINGDIVRHKPTGKEL